MTDITRVFDYQTRVLRNAERKYSGQMFDANATTIHFEYDPINFLAHDENNEYWVPYIVFSVMDGCGRNLVYGPDGTLNNPRFDGYTFTIPWDVTSRVSKTRRVDYQLWFVRNTVDFDPVDGVANLASTQYILSETDSIVIKPSIGYNCKCKNQTLPSSTPDIIGQIEHIKEFGVVLPVEVGTNPDTGKQALIFHTQNHRTEYVDLPGGATVLGDATNAELDLWASDPEQYGIKPGDVYNCTEPRTYNGDLYKAGTDWIWRGDAWEPLTAGQDLEEIKQAIADLQGDIATIDSRLDADETAIQTNADAITALGTRVDTEIARITTEQEAQDAAIQANSTAIEANSGAIEALGTRLTSDEASIASVQASVASLDTRLTADEVNISANTEDIATLSGHVSDLTARADAIETDVTALGGRVTDLTTEVGNIRSSLADYTRKDQAIPVWEPLAQYVVNSTVLYEDSIYIAVQDNMNHEPIDPAYWTQISGQGGGGGGGTNIRRKSIQFGNTTDTSYQIVHNLGTYDFLFSIRTNDNTRRYIYADVCADSPTTAMVYLSDPPGDNALIMNILEISTSSQSKTIVETQTISTPSDVWTYRNTSGYPVFIQAFEGPDANGWYDEIRGNVDQLSTTEPPFDPVTDRFDRAVSGEMVIVRSTMAYPFTNDPKWEIEHDFGEYFAVQCYTNEYGMIAGDVQQDGNTVTIRWGTDMTGYAVLMKPTLTVPITAENTQTGDGVKYVEIDHDIGRLCAVQVYNSEWDQAMCNVEQNGSRILVSWNAAGNLLGGRIIVL